MKPTSFMIYEVHCFYKEQPFFHLEEWPPVAMKRVRVGSQKKLACPEILKHITMNLLCQLLVYCEKSMDFSGSCEGW